MGIGSIVQGGILFYSGSSFSLIAATEDIHMSLLWGCYKTGIDGTSTALGAGSTNTNLILSGCTGNTMIAATVCFRYSGYTGWFLPSKDELNEMYLVKDIIGGFDSYDNYWSSSQSTSECAWMQFFRDGIPSDKGGKDQLYRVRPIRFAT
jgi:hypothetical protein